MLCKCGGQTNLIGSDTEKCEDCGNIIHVSMTMKKEERKRKGFVMHEQVQREPQVVAALRELEGGIGTLGVAISDLEQRLEVVLMPIAPPMIKEGTLSGKLAEGPPPNAPILEHINLINSYLHVKIQLIKGIMERLVT